jgi:hypothetical protein
MKTEIRHHHHTLPLAASIALALVYTLGLLLAKFLPHVAANLGASWLGSGLTSGEFTLIGWLKGVVNTFVLTYLIVALTQHVNAFLHRK